MICSIILGRRNYRYFLSFLLSVLLHMFIVLGFSVYYLLKHHSNLFDPSTLVSLILLVLITLLTIPIGGLTIFHFLLIVRGRTTNEQVTGKFQSNLNPVTILLFSSLLSSRLGSNLCFQFDDGWISNCGRTLSSSRYPQYSSFSSLLFIQFDVFVFLSTV